MSLAQLELKEERVSVGGNLVLKWVTRCKCDVEQNFGLNTADGLVSVRYGWIDQLLFLHSEAFGGISVPDLIRGLLTDHAWDIAVKYHPSDMPLGRQHGPVFT